MTAKTMATIQRPSTGRTNARSRRPVEQEPKKNLVYRHVPHKPEHLVFSSRDRAFQVHLIWTAINCAKTWGEFIEMLPDGEWQTVSRYMSDRLPRRREVFSAESLPGFSDGDYPPWLQTEIGRYIPGVTLEEFGLRESSSINGPFWTIPAEIEQPLVDRLRQLGYTIELREEWYFY